MNQFTYFGLGKFRYDTPDFWVIRQDFYMSDDFSNKLFANGRDTLLQIISLYVSKIIECRLGK